MDRDSATPATSQDMLPGSAMKGGLRVVVKVLPQDKDQWT